MAKERKSYSTGAFWFVVPAMIVLLVVGIIPLLFALWTSFQQFILTKAHFKGTILDVREATSEELDHGHVHGPGGHHHH